MFDAREPLYQHGLTLEPGDEGTVAVWKDGEEKLTTDAEGLLRLGEEVERGQPPDWLTPGKSEWPVEMVGTVLMAVARKLSEDTETLIKLYGGQPFGPAGPDIRHAGLVIEDDKQTLKWVA